MQIVIDIPEEDYKGICYLKNEQLRMLPEEVAETLIRISNGIPLPKGHGVLKDVTNIMRGLYTDMQTVEETFTSSDVYKMIDKECPTIIEADKAEGVETDDGWCNTCEYKHLESECLGCAKYDEYDNLIALSNYKKESEVRN